jgi:hypothetical protein
MGDVASGVFRLEVFAASIDEAFEKGELCIARRPTFAPWVCSSPSLLLQFLPANAATPIRIDTKNLLVSVDAVACRWSAEVKGTPMRLNDVYFLPGDDPSGWKVTSSVNNEI